MLRTVVFFASASSKHILSVHQLVPRPISIISLRCLADKSKWDEPSHTKSGKKAKRNEGIEKSRINNNLKKNQQQIEELKDIRAELIKERKFLKKQIKSSDEEYTEKRDEKPRSSKYKVSYSSKHTDHPSKHEYSMRVSKPERWVEEKPRDIRKRYKDYAKAHSKEKIMEIEEKKQKNLRDRKLSPVVYPPVSDAKYSPLDEMRQQIIDKRKTEMDRKKSEETTEEIRHWVQPKEHDPDLDHEIDRSQNAERLNDHGHNPSHRNKKEQQTNESHKSSVGFKQRKADSDKGSDISDHRIGTKKPSKEQSTDRPQQGQKPHDQKPGVGFTQRPKSRSDDAKTTSNTKAMLKPHKVHDYQSAGHENVELPVILPPNYSTESNISTLPDEVLQHMIAQTQSSETTPEENIQEAEDELRQLRSELIKLNAKSNQDKIDEALASKTTEQKIAEAEMELKQLLAEHETLPSNQKLPNHIIRGVVEKLRMLRTQKKSLEEKFTPIDELEKEDEEADQNIIEVEDDENLIDQHLPEKMIQENDEENDEENVIVDYDEGDDIISKISEEDIEPDDAPNVLSAHDESEIETSDALEFEEESEKEDSALYKLMKSIAQGRTESQKKIEEYTSPKSHREPISARESDFEYETHYQKFHSPSSLKLTDELRAIQKFEPKAPHALNELEAMSESGRASEDAKVNNSQIFEATEMNKPSMKQVETAFAGKPLNIDSKKMVKGSSIELDNPHFESINEHLETDTETASLTESGSKKIANEKVIREKDEDAWKHMTFAQQEGLGASEIEATNLNNKNEDRIEEILLKDASQSMPRREKEISEQFKDLQNIATSVELEKPHVELEVIDDVSRTAQKFVLKATKVKKFGHVPEFNEFGPKHELELSAQTFLRSLESFVKALKMNEEVIDSSNQDKNQTDNKDTENTTRPQ